MDKTNWSIDQWVDYIVDLIFQNNKKPKKEVEKMENKTPKQPFELTIDGKKITVGKAVYFTNKKGEMKKFVLNEESRIVTINGTQVLVRLMEDGQPSAIKVDSLDRVFIEDGKYVLGKIDNNSGLSYKKQVFRRSEIGRAGSRVPRVLAGISGRREF
jgi:hypothetical protein